MKDLDLPYPPPIRLQDMPPPLPQIQVQFQGEQPVEVAQAYDPVRQVHVIKWRFAWGGEQEARVARWGAGELGYFQPPGRLGLDEEPTKEANERSLKFLLEHLDIQQRHEFALRGRFVVYGSGGLEYEITNALPTCGPAFHTFNVVDTNKVFYCLIFGQCHHLQIPQNDALLAQKLLLETDEQMFKQIANHALGITWGINPKPPEIPNHIRKEFEWAG